VKDLEDLKEKDLLLFIFVWVKKYITVENNISINTADFKY
jgi:hypothetical protein